MSDLRLFAWNMIADLVAILAKGLGLLILWKWFLSDLFGVRALNLPEALGLSLIVVFLVRRYREPETDEKKSIEQKQNAIAFWIFSLVFVVVLGWFLHLFR